MCPELNKYTYSAYFQGSVRRPDISWRAQKTEFPLKVYLTFHVIILVEIMNTLINFIRVNALLY